VTEQISQRDLSRHPWIKEAEVRVVIDRPVVPADHALADQPRQHRRGHRLRHRGELKDRIRIHRRRRAGLPDTEPFEIEDLIPVDDADRHTGDARLLDGLLDELLQLGQGSVDFLERDFRRRSRLDRQADQEEQRRGAAPATGVHHLFPPNRTRTRPHPSVSTLRRHR
jgi:hypothetical protein